MIAEIDLPADEQTRTVTGRLKPTETSKNPAVGPTLVRHWRGRDIVVLIREDGIEHEGDLYRSLSAVARAVTGSRWNGRLFFGLTQRRKAQ